MLVLFAKRICQVHSITRLQRKAAPRGTWKCSRLHRRRLSRMRMYSDLGRVCVSEDFIKNVPQHGQVPTRASRAIDVLAKTYL